MPFTSMYIREVIRLYGASPDRMGSFPLPDFDVLVAAEVLKSHIVQGPYSHAVEVARVRVGGRDRFVFANSGVPGVLLANLNAARTDLRRVLGSTVDYVQVSRGSDFYEPLHREVDIYLRRVRADFDASAAPARLVRHADIVQAIDAFWLAFSGPAQVAGPDLAAAMHPNQLAALNQRIHAVRQAAGHHGVVRTDQAILDRSQLSRAIAQRGQQRIALTASGNEANALGTLLAGVLAVRLRMVEPAGRENAIASLRALQMRLQNTAISPWMPPLGSAVGILLQAGAQVDAPNVPVVALKTQVDTAFRHASQSRYCAEPRVFGAIGHDDEAHGRLLSQACFWHVGNDGTANPVEYRVIGPQESPADAALSGSYMWACTSCRARSAHMLAGIERGLPASRPHEV